MCIVFVLVGDICKSEHIQLNLADTASGIDWEEDWPGNAAANEANDHCDLQEAEEKVAVKGIMLQDICIGNLPVAISLRSISARIPFYTLLIAGIHPNKVLGSGGDFSCARREPRCERGEY